MLLAKTEARAGPLYSPQKGCPHLGLNSQPPELRDGAFLSPKPLGLWYGMVTAPGAIWQGCPVRTDEIRDGEILCRLWGNTLHTHICLFL